jgi:hypothetical protein
MADFEAAIVSSTSLTTTNNLQSYNKPSFILTVFIKKSDLLPDERMKASYRAQTHMEWIRIGSAIKV